MIRKIDDLMEGTHRYFRSIVSNNPDVFSKCMCTRVGGKAIRCICKGKSSKKCRC